MAVLDQPTNPFNAIQDVERHEKELFLLPGMYHLMIYNLLVDIKCVARPKGAEKVDAKSLRNQTRSYYFRLACHRQESEKFFRLQVGLGAVFAVFLQRINIMITTRHELEEAAVNFGILPFFPNNIKGFSVEEMTPPALLFGGNEYEGCWEWKGPVVRERTTAYGKFFRKKAGFVSRELLPYFLTFRRGTNEISPGSSEEMIFDIIDLNDGMTSTELRESLIGSPKRRTAYDLPDMPGVGQPEFIGKRPSRHSLEGPLQRLQMGGWICISDFQYKLTKKGERYGWGVARYSTPESVFSSDNLSADLSPQECLDFIIDYVRGKFRGASPEALRKLLS